MTDDAQRWKNKRRRLWLALTALVVLLGVLLVPPMLSLGRYKSRIARLMSESLGRPVRLASVELHLLPVPAFVATDLVVDDDPAYSAEPILRADTVSASIRLMSLWRGRLEISTVSMDFASVNIVRTPEGRWNLDPLFRTAAAREQPDTMAGHSGRKSRLPYMEATNARINFKSGVEKLPFSLLSSELSFWQEQPGDWRIRLRGQPARTDLSLNLPDTGVVRMEARVRQARELRQMPVHVDLEWREAQLGQLARLVAGSDPGWRGDLTGELHLDGTADAAQIKTRLRATGVHREEFAPAAPMDFDATCGFLYRLTVRSTENLLCDSPLGDGRIHVAGDVPGNGNAPRLSVELDKIPVAAGLDALRTVRSGFAPGLEAAGLISGKIAYAEAAPAMAGNETRVKKIAADHGRVQPARVEPPPDSPLKGSLTIDGFQLTGGGLTTPIAVEKLLIEPSGSVAENDSPALLTRAAIPAGGPNPLMATARLGIAGYALTVRGEAGMAQAKELAQVAGLKLGPAADALTGDAVTIESSAHGPWMLAARTPFTDDPGQPGSLDLPRPVAAEAPEDIFTGTATLHKATWGADYLARQVEIETATLHFGGGPPRWDSVAFVYGPVKGRASLALPGDCAKDTACPLRFTVHLGPLTGSDLQTALLGARMPGTLFSSVMARLRPASPAASSWPSMVGTVTVDSLTLGAVQLDEPTATVGITATGAEIREFNAQLLGGSFHGKGTVRNAAAGEAKPDYALEGHFENLSPAAVGTLLGLAWSGGSLDADGRIELAGFTGEDLSASAKGRLHFDWRHGGAVKADAAADDSDAVPPALARFDRWSADASVAGRAITLEDNQVVEGAQTRAVDGAVTLADPPKVTFSQPAEPETQAQQ